MSSARLFHVIAAGAVGVALMGLATSWRSVPTARRYARPEPSTSAAPLVPTYAAERERHHDNRLRHPGNLRAMGADRPAITDPSPVVREFIDTHYLETLGRFFFAFQRTLPELSRDDLGFRLNFAMGALSGILAGGNTQRLIRDFTQGQGDQEVVLLSRLISLMVAALKAPLPGPNDTTVLDAIVSLPAMASLGA